MGIMTTDELGVHSGRAFNYRGVADEINCSSSGHHFQLVRFTHNGKRMSGWWFFESGCLEVYGQKEGRPPLSIKFPAYFITSVKAGIRAALPTAKVFEYDRDGNKRYNDLRYHPDDWIERTIERWTS